MNYNALRKGAAGAAAISGLALWYLFAVRPWHRRWGVTNEELRETLPGDDVKLDACVQVTHGITIDARPDEVWKWLVQIGQDRGGFYSYDWLENAFGLQVQNTDEIRPEWQQLKVGDFVRSAHRGWLGGRFDDKAGWFVVGLEPDRSLVLRDEMEQGSWAFVLKPIGGKTRLLIRARGDGAKSVGRTLLNILVIEPAHFIMERKMLLTLKEKAERPNRGESGQRLDRQNQLTSI